ncbi:hypothetical protein QTV33_000982 [Vibrio parahaemolyticus]|nr:hypothetical protein [Vibrio parahaemolyticus]
MSRKNKSKLVLLDDKFYEPPSAPVEPIHLSELKLKCNGVTSRIEQLLYKGAPNYSPQGMKINNVEYVPVVEREAFLRDVYRTLAPDFNITKRAHFNQLRLYIRWLDNTNRSAVDGDYFHPDLYNAYMDYHQQKCNQGEQKLSTWSGVKKMLSFFLKSKNRIDEAKTLKSIKRINEQTKSHTGIDPIGELQPLVRLFIASFAKFRDSVIDGTDLKVHPFWNEELFNQTAERERWSPTKKAASRRAFRYTMRTKFSVFNHFSRLAAMLAFCFTGQNAAPLLNLRFSDIRFTNYSSGKVFFDMTKARARYLDIDTSLGFHQKAQDFFYQWLEISREFQKDFGTDWLFPYLMATNEIKSFIDANQAAPQEKINNLTRKLGFSHINPSILRQTKIDVLMKVTQDIWLVAMSANNSINTIAVSYSDGIESDHRNSLAASSEALYDTMKNGTDIHEAANNAKFNFSNVLSEYDYKRLRKEDKINDKQTPVGTRCIDSSQGVANSVKKNLERLGIEQSEDATCTDFLGCFECTHHRLVSEVEDIWLMLSFNDTLQEMQDYPALNSLPTTKYYKLRNTIEAILKRFKEVSPNNYFKAQTMHNEAPHPLYSDGYSLIDLLDAY